MKLQLGKRYRTRDGRETSPIQRSSNPSYPFKAEVADRIETWRENGIWNIKYKEEYHLNLVEEIEESEEKQEPKIDYDKMSEELEETHNSFTYTWNESKYTKIEEEDGTIILKPKKRKVWIEVYEYDGEISAIGHTTKDSLNKSIKLGQEDGETLLEVIEREYPINNK